jgi:hypothetical protein
MQSGIAAEGLGPILPCSLAIRTGQQPPLKRSVPNARIGQQGEAHTPDGLEFGLLEWTESKPYARCPDKGARQWSLLSRREGGISAPRKGVCRSVPKRAERQFGTRGTPDWGCACRIPVGVRHTTPGRHGWHGGRCAVDTKQEFGTHPRTGTL